MKIEFASDDLARICTDDAYKMGLPVSVIQMARSRLLQLESFKDERDLRNIKSLRYKKLQADPQGRRSIRINEQYRIYFTLSEGEIPPTICIVFIGDPH